MATRTKIHELLLRVFLPTTSKFVNFNLIGVISRREESFMRNHPSTVRFETLLVQTASNLLGAWLEIIAYILVFVLYWMLDPSSPGGVLGLLRIPIFIGGLYFIYRAMLERADAMETDRTEIFALIGMAALMSMPIALASFLLLFPGLFLATKLIMAPSFLVARSEDIFTSSSDSWRQTRCHEIPIALAIIAIVLLWSVFGSLLGMLDEAMTDAGWIVLEGIGKTLQFPFLLIFFAGLSTAAFQLIVVEQVPNVAEPPLA
jgi:uncharacterized membrane protein YkgB